MPGMSGQIPFHRGQGRGPWNQEKLCQRSRLYHAEELHFLKVITTSQQTLGNLKLVEVPIMASFTPTPCSPPFTWPRPAKQTLKLCNVYSTFRTFRGCSKNVPEIKFESIRFENIPTLAASFEENTYTVENDRGPIYWSVNHISDSALKMMIFSLPQNTNFYCSCFFILYFSFFAFILPFLLPLSSFFFSSCPLSKFFPQMISVDISSEGGGA